MVSRQPEKQVSVSYLVDLLLLDRLHKMGSMSKLKLLNRGLTPQVIRQMEDCGILRATPDDFGITQYTVVDDFLTKLT